MHAHVKAPLGTIVPTLRYRDVAAAIDWLCKAFDFERHLVVPGEKGDVCYAELTFGGGMIMLGPVANSAFEGLMTQPADAGGVETQICYLFVEDAAAHCAQAKAAGAEIMLDIEGEDGGGRGYSCRDPEGHIWNFGTYNPWKRHIAEVGGSDRAERQPRRSAGFLKRSALAAGMVVVLATSVVVADWAARENGWLDRDGGLSAAAGERTYAKVKSVREVREAADRAAREARERLSRERVAREAAERASRAAREQAAMEHQGKEAAERAAKELQSSLALERNAREAAERAARAAHERLAKAGTEQALTEVRDLREQLSQAERAAAALREELAAEQSAREAREQLEKKAAEKEAAERSRQAREKEAKERSAKEAAERAEREAAEREEREERAREARERRRRGARPAPRPRVSVQPQSKPLPAINWLGG